MLTSATVSVFRLTCSCCLAANLMGSVTLRQPSWTGQKTLQCPLTGPLQKQQDTTSDLLFVVLSCRETNMKVRQSVSVTAELGNPNNLASFDGEVWLIFLRFHLWFILFDKAKFNGFPVCFRLTLSSFTLLHITIRNTRKTFNPHRQFMSSSATTDWQPIITHPPACTTKELCVSTPTHPSPAQENALLQHISPHFASYQLTAVSLPPCVCLGVRHQPAVMGMISPSLAHTSREIYVLQ